MREWSRRFAATLALLILLGALYFITTWVTTSGSLPLIHRGRLPGITYDFSQDRVNATGIKFEFPANFRLSIFADSLQAPRVLVIDPQGTLLVSDRDASQIVALLDPNHREKSTESRIVAQDLDSPHGLVFLPDGRLVIAEHSRLGIWHYDAATFTASFERTLFQFPTEGVHTSRTVQVGRDGYLYVSIGSSCNVCHEDDPRRASVYRIHPETGEASRWAWGLRNLVFFIQQPVTGLWFGTEMGRDFLGDTLPPDELNLFPPRDPAGDYGWPRCYGNNVHDTDFEPGASAQNPCQEPAYHPTHYDFPAHVAPLGLTFIPKDAGWPAEMEGDLLVAFHGSWNRTERIGYKIVRLELDGDQTVVATHDFLTGFLDENKETIYGRPVDLYFDASGVLYISDDGAGRIYRMQPMPN